MELKFTPKSIRTLEINAGDSFIEVAGAYTFNNLYLLLEAGGIQDVDGSVTAYLESGKELMDLYLDILEALQDQGFLPKAVGVSEAREKVHAALSQNSGN